MYEWQTHYPSQCPPSTSVELSGEVYRFINKRNPTYKDFMSHYERDPTKVYSDACKARGLSILRTKDDCKVMRAAIPALRKKQIAVANITTRVGLTANTPSTSCPGHCTWWRNPSPEDITPLFITLDEQRDDEND